MANDVDVKTKISEKDHDNFLILSRQLGFETRSQCLRYLVKRELYGAMAQVQTNRSPGAVIGRDLDD